MNQGTERRHYPNAADLAENPNPGAPTAETLEYSETLRQRLTRYALTLLDRIDSDGGPVLPDGSPHPLLDLALSTVDSGTELRRLAMERRLGGAVLDYRARRPVAGGDSVTKENCVRDMENLAADSKAGMVHALVRRGHSLADARELADRVSVGPASHRAACERIGEVLEFRPV